MKLLPTSSTRFALPACAATLIFCGAISSAVVAEKMAAPTTPPAFKAAVSSAQVQSQSPLSEEQKAIHVLNRLAFGPRSGDVETVRRIGVAKWIEQQLAPKSLEDSAIQTQLRNFKTLNYSNAQLWLAYVSSRRLRQIRNDERKKAASADAGNDFKPKVINAAQQRVLDDARREGFGDQVDLQIVGEMLNAKLLRATESKNQLQEVLVDFWSNHFNLDINKQQVQTLRLADERDAIRPHVLGNFRAMLGASAHSPAMMIYLDNARSTTERTGASPQQKQRRARFLQNQARRNQARRNQARRNQAKQSENAADSLKADSASADSSADDSTAMMMESDKSNTKMPDNTLPVAKPKRGGLNENYARELMELHTLGVGGGYTQKDVTEVARCFTGWSVNKEGEFEFFPNRHDNGEKTVFGQTIPANGGQKDGERVLDLLAKSPATARFLSRKMVTRFVNDVPPAALVERAAQTFLRTDGDLRAVTKTIVTSPEFFARANYRVKIKSPFEYAVSSVRALNGRLVLADAETSNERQMLIADGAAIARPNRKKNNANKMLGRQIAQMGQPLYAFQAPTGYSENSAHWVSSGALVARLNFALDLTNGRLNDVEISRDQVFKGISTDDKNAMLDSLIATTLHGEISASTRKVVEQQLKTDATFDAAKAGALLLGSPEFQRR